MKGLISEHPDLEAIGAYLEGRLSKPERARITEHLASCEHCSFAFSETAQMHVATTSDEKTGWRAWLTPAVLWPSSIGALATAAAVWLIVGAGALAPWGPAQSPGLTALVAAVGAERPIEARLTSGFAYGSPRRSATRAAAPSTQAGSPDVRIAAAQIEKEAIAHRTPQSLNALGIAYLVVGDVARAISVLEEAANQPKPDAQILSNLSAAYFARAVRTNQPQEFARALGMAERAVNADSRLAEAWFNRAYALERMSLTDQARQAWQDYLKIDDSSPWAEEARSHLETLRVP